MGKKNRNSNNATKQGEDTMSDQDQQDNGTTDTTATTLISGEPIIGDKPNVELPPAGDEPAVLGTSTAETITSNDVGDLGSVLGLTNTVNDTAEPAPVGTPVGAVVGDLNPAPAPVVEAAAAKSVEEAAPVAAAPADAPVVAAPAPAEVQPMILPVHVGLVGQSAIASLQQYVINMKPRTPIEPGTGARHQQSLYRALINIIDKTGNDFEPVFGAALQLFHNHADGAFHEKHVFRFMEHVQLSPDERTAFQRLLNMMKLAADPKGRHIALKQMNFESTLKAPMVSEAGRQRVMAFFNL